jgi:hypothetical protein
MKYNSKLGNAWLTTNNTILTESNFDTSIFFSQSALSAV